MKKWKCENESCGKNCTLSVDYRPVQCPRGLVWVAKWQEMGETVAESNQLPKLTAEVFDHPGCPDWCKVGEWVAYYGDNGYKYFKIAKIELNRLYSEDGKFSLMCNVAQARLRPYTPDEMRALIGKVIVEKKSGDIGLVTGYCNRNESVYAGRNDFVAALLLSDYTIDGQPCGVLEHMENGEWVE